MRTLMAAVLIFMAAVSVFADENNSNYFTGDGGKGLTLAVLEPSGKGLSEAERYLLPLVQGSITGDFNKYSAMTIIDRQNLDKILAEQTQSMSGNYSEEEYLRIGELANARYILSGTITKTASTYVLEVSVSDAETGVRKASYPPRPVTSLALENLSAVKEASADLLAQLGVLLTEKGKQELLAAANTASINAETALSKALTAQKNGTVVEALSYYYQAVSYDPLLAEAASRLNVLSTNISSGNISSGNMGADARNDIQWRKNWIARLTEAEQYYANYMKDPAPYSLVYSTDLRQDNINYQAETLDISGVTVYLILNNRSWFAIPANVINQIWQGLAATGRTKDWGLNWPAKSVSTGSAFVDQNGKFNVSVELLNDKKNVIGKQNVALSYRWWRGIYQDSGALVITPVEDSAINVTFSGVKADDITDRLNINIAGIDGVNAQTVAQNKRISIMPIDEYTKNDIVYKIGDKGPAGGIVFHDRGISINGWRYVEVAPKESEKKLSWYDAISYCQNLNIGGYTDWHLPDYSELNFMYQNLKTKGLGGFSDNWYWSSWELGANDSWRQRFSDGHQSNFSKSTTSSVRSVRAF